MRLDRILQVLLPKDEHFFDLFEEAARTIEQAAETLLQLTTAPREQWERIVYSISELEHQGDALTHRMNSELSGTFVTPFDAEDIHLLASEMDDIVDLIDGSARRLLLYKVQACPPDMVKLMYSLQGSVKEVAKGVHQLRKLNKPAEMREVIKRINAFEDEADAIFAHAVADLFDTVKDPIEIIKLKEVYVALETATDKCEDVADVLESIAIKHA